MKINRHVEALCFSRYTHAQWQLARKVAKTTAHADMRKQLSLDPLSRRCVTEREGPELDYTVLGISSGKRASNNRQIVKIIYQFNL